MSADKRRTITLTGRPPVAILEEEWPTLASTSLKENGGIGVTHTRWCRIRQHADGRAIVHAGYDFKSTTHSGEQLRGEQLRGGKLLPAGTTTAEICQAVHDVCSNLSELQHRAHELAWGKVALACIGDMPAEEL